MAKTKKTVTLQLKAKDRKQTRHHAARPGQIIFGIKMEISPNESIRIFGQEKKYSLSYRYRGDDGKRPVGKRPVGKQNSASQQTYIQLWNLACVLGCNPYGDMFDSWTDQDIEEVLVMGDALLEGKEPAVKPTVVSIHVEEAIDRIFKMEDLVNYDSFNLTYLGFIKKISTSYVEVQDEHGHRGHKRLDLHTFYWRNRDLDINQIRAQNDVTSMSI